MESNQHGGRRANQTGRPRKALEARTPRADGKLAFWIDLEHAAKLQALMMKIIPGVNTPEQMIEHLIDQATAARSAAAEMAPPP